MLVLGPISSLYDFLTFAVMLGVFHAGAALFRTGWFVESLATQTLVIFVIRTARQPVAQPAEPRAGRGVGTAVAVGIALPFTPLGRLARLHAAAAAVLRGAADDDRGVPRARRGRQALVLPPLSHVGGDATS